MAANTVRSISDLRALAAHSAAIARAEQPTKAATIDAFIRQVSDQFPATMAIPTAFAKLADFWKALGATRAESTVRSVAREYWINVEGGGSAANTSSPAALVVQGAPAVTVDAAVPVYQRPWFPPVAATVVVGVAAAVLFGFRRRRR